jgi:hypothetical protein
MHAGGGRLGQWLPGRGLNATEYNPPVVNTTAYIARFQALK